MSLRESAQAWMLQRPALLRAFVLRWQQAPIHRFGDVTFVLGHGPVLDVLARERDFHLADSMRSRILSGPFLLSTEPPGQYLTDKENMCEALFGDAGIMAGIAETSRAQAQSRLHAARSVRTIDAVGGLLEPTAAHIVQRFLIGPDTAAAPADGLLDSLRTLAELIVTADPSDKKLRKAARRATDFVEGLVDKRLQDTATSRDMTSRLRAMAMEKSEIVRLVAGLAGTATATIARAGGQALDELLNRPGELEAAAGFARNEDRETILQFVLEALRFNPMFAFTPRTVVRDTAILANGIPYPVKAHESLAVSLLAAMFDSQAFPEPRRFMTNRPRESYLHFGYGYHRCFGGPVAELQFKEVFTQLLGLDGLRRDTRQHGGRLCYDWPALKSLQVRWGEP